MCIAPIDVTYICICICIHIHILYILYFILYIHYVQASNWAVSCDSSSMDVSDTRLASEHTELLNSNTSSDQSPQHHLISPPQPSFSPPSAPPPLSHKSLHTPCLFLHVKGWFHSPFLAPFSAGHFLVDKIFFVEKSVVLAE